MNHTAPHPPTMNPQVTPHRSAETPNQGELPQLPTPKGTDVIWGGTSLVTGLLGAMAGAVLADRLLGLHGADMLAVLLMGAGLGLWVPLFWCVIRRRGWSLKEIGFRRGRHSLLHLIYQVCPSPWWARSS